MPFRSPTTHSTARSSRRRWSSSTTCELPWPRSTAYSLRAETCSRPYRAGEDLRRPRTRSGASGGTTRRRDRPSGSRRRHSARATSRSAGTGTCLAAGVSLRPGRGRSAAGRARGPRSTVRGDSGHCAPVKTSLANSGLCERPLGRYREKLRYGTGTGASTRGSGNGARACPGGVGA